MPEKILPNDDATLNKLVAQNKTAQVKLITAIGDVVCAVILARKLIAALTKGGQPVTEIQVCSSN